ncbi:hypothetical protein [Sphingomonas solaris]|uniref:Uncharacterized protein n=1 Tax=Alterirhizorhabdus solaris TaxID=2529389 RepID=A0A558RAN0_9SPHN|nr:hypothetical protein [Sphingomonas solaris]TVV76424.1 hypothetical protein FOY91_04145 [Sphingomonas solaris]
MGLADRDYMRERHRQRTGATKWNERKTRVEMDDGMPLGSASWVADTGGWFERKNRGFDYQKGRWRPGRQARPGAVQKWIIALSALTFLIPGYREAKRNGWFPDMQPAVTFPRSGSVTVNRNVDPHKATARLRVTTDQANAVVQLYDRDTDEHIISVYFRRDDEATLAVPPGEYRMQIVEGYTWHGPANYFGSSTTADTVIAEMRFGQQAIHGIDLHRRPNGNLNTRPNLATPTARD